jgi:hypothetical protein
MWMGVVEDNNDPIKLGRLKVRIFGWHSGSLDEADGEQGVKTADLPWAQVMQPVNNGPNSGKGGPVTGIQQGTWVMGMFLDGEIAREPMVMGSIPGIPTEANPNVSTPDFAGNFSEPEEGFYDPDGVYPLPTRLGEPDTNRLARNDNVKVHGDPADYPHPRIESRKNSASEYTTASGYDFVEPAFDSWKDFKAKYPDNKVWETKSGHVFEVDDSSKFERIHIAHKNGSYIEMGGAAGPGNRIDKVAGDWMLLASDQMIMNSIGQLSITSQHTNIQSQTIALKTAGGVTITGSLKVVGGATFEGGGGFKSGATDTFTAVGGRIVTVMNGIITSVSPA